MKTKDPLLELHTMVQGTLRAFPNTRERQKALKAIQWRLRGPNGEYVGLNAKLDCAFIPETQVVVFSGQDNESRKLEYYQSILGPLTIEILPQDK